MNTQSWMMSVAALCLTVLATGCDSQQKTQPSAGTPQMQQQGQTMADQMKGSKKGGMPQGMPGGPGGGMPGMPGAPGGGGMPPMPRPR